MATPFLGQIMIVPYNFAPQGWAFCNGQLLSIAQNTALFALIGTIYGGDGRSNFALPNLQGRVPVGAGQGLGLSEYTIGQSGGEQTHTLDLQEMPEHDHALNGSTTTGTTALPEGSVPAVPNAQAGY